jgi:hypothetical protein
MATLARRLRDLETGLRTTPCIACAVARHAGTEAPCHHDRSVSIAATVRAWWAARGQNAEAENGSNA